MGARETGCLSMEMGHRAYGKKIDQLLAVKGGYVKMQKGTLPESTKAVGMGSGNFTGARGLSFRCVRCFSGQGEEAALGRG